MNYQYLDMERYKRKDHFNYFNSLAYPYVGLTANIEITKFITAVKERKIPFFLSFNYCVARAANRVPEFRQRVIDGKIAQFDSCKTSHTVSLEDGTYCYCTLSVDAEFKDYLPYAIQAQQRAKIIRNTDDKDENMQELFFISSLPWLSYTSLINPVPVPADSNPRITWGKYFTQGTDTLIPVSVLCNHALVDGLHISQFYKELNELLEHVSNEINTLNFSQESPV